MATTDNAQQQPANESPIWQPRALTKNESDILLAAFKRTRGGRRISITEAKTLLDFVDEFKIQRDQWRDVFTGQTGVDVVDGQVCFKPFDEPAKEATETDDSEALFFAILF